MKQYNVLNFQNLYQFVILTRNYYNCEYREIQETPYQTRHQYYVKPFIRNNYEKATIRYQIPKLLNKLPEHLRQIDEANTMKREVKKHFLINNEI